MAIIAVLIGVITGVFGGVLRDIVINEVPVVFTPGGFYATAVFAGGCIYTGGVVFGMPHPLAVNLGIGVTVTLRLLSIRYGLKLPAPRERRPHSSAPPPAGGNTPDPGDSVGGLEE